MRIVDVFNHALESIMAKLSAFKYFVLFVAVVIFAFMVAMQSGEAIESILSKNFESIGAKNLRITSIQTGKENALALKAEDVDFLKGEGGKNFTAVYGRLRQDAVVRVGSQAAPAIIQGVSPDFSVFSRVPVLEGGKFIDKDDMLGLRSVVVVTRGFAEKYFKRLNIAGETLTIELPEGKSEKFQVVGVLENEGFLVPKPFRQAYISEIYIPLTVATRFFEKSALDYIEVRVKEGLNIDAVAGSVAKILEFKQTGSVYAVRKSIDVIEAQSQVSGSAGLLVAAMGLISLGIGFLGIFCYMDVSNRFRGEEIAVRKLTGARDNDIFLQFQMETLLLTALGGVIGIVLGMVFGILQFSLFGFGTIINTGAVFMTMMFVLVLGVSGGYFPAKTAAAIRIAPHVRQE